MISTETLEAIARDLRKRQNSFQRGERFALTEYYDAKFDLLEELIIISKEEEKGGNKNG